METVFVTKSWFLTSTLFQTLFLRNHCKYRRKNTRGLKFRNMCSEKGELTGELSYRKKAGFHALVREVLHQTFSTLYRKSLMVRKIQNMWCLLNLRSKKSPMTAGDLPPSQPFKVHGEKTNEFKTKRFTARVSWTVRFRICGALSHAFKTLSQDSESSTTLTQDLSN